MDRRLVGRSCVVDRTLVGRGGVVDITLVGNSGVVGRTLVGCGGVVVRTSDSQSREPRFESFCSCFEVCAISSNLCCLSSV